MLFGFGKRRVFLPVIHIQGGRAGALASIAVAFEGGADGVFLINQGMGTAEMMTELLPRARAQHPGFWIGVNVLGLEPAEILARYRPDWISGIWSDDAGVDAMNAQRVEHAAAQYTAAVAKAKWPGLYFGGTAFKTQRPIPADKLADVARAAAAFMDVVTTSGLGTGRAADLEKVKTMRAAIPGKPMALASGITPENVAQYLPYVEAYLVATGIEKTFGVLDPQKVRALADTIHGYAG